MPSDAELVAQAGDVAKNCRKSAEQGREWLSALRSELDRDPSDETRRELQQRALRHLQRLNDDLEYARRYLGKLLDRAVAAGTSEQSAPFRAAINTLLTGGEFDLTNARHELYDFCRQGSPGSGSRPR